jgi:hypothetical protein
VVFFVSSQKIIMMKKRLLFSLLTLFTALQGFSQTRHISPSGDDTGNDCLLPGNPCATISHAVSQAQPGDSVLLAAGNYSFLGSQVVDKRVIVAGADSLNKPVITAIAGDIIQVTADSVTIRDLRIEMGLTILNGLKGIVASGSYNGLMIINNEIYSTKNLSSGMVFGSYGILASGGTGQMVHIMGNIIQPLDSVRDAHGRAIGIGLNGASGPAAMISGNTARAFYPIQSLSTNGDLMIDNNMFSGNTLITYPNAGTAIEITNNTFDAYNDLVASNLATLAEIRAVNNSTVLIEGNSFLNYKNIALFSSASRNVTVKDNVFTPLPTANAFISLMANSKLFTAGTQNTSYANKIEVMGNSFNAGVAGTGAAIVYGDHYGVTSPAFQDTLMVGGPNQADKNIFNTDLLYYIVLDSLSGPSDAQPFWAGYSVTTMVPFSQSVWALAAYNEYNITDTLLLEEKMLDSLDVTGLGKVVLFDALITGVEQNLSQDLSLYPNPANDFVMLNTAALNGTSTIRLFDVTGKMVDNFNTTQSSAQLMIPVQQLSSGLYFVTVENNGNFFTAKFSRK